MIEQNAGGKPPAFFLVVRPAGRTYLDYMSRPGFSLNFPGANVTHPEEPL
jgi:hypothetical protein